MCFVLLKAYTIQIIQASSGLDRFPTQISRRYSDFSHLHSALCSRFSSSMIKRELSLPPKLLSRNFRPETIAQRSRGFEQYLAHAFSIDSVRRSDELADFLVGPELRAGYARIANGDYPGAVCTLVPVWHLERKLVGDRDQAPVATLCAVVASHAADENDAAACRYAERALACIAGPPAEPDPHLVPLLRLAIRLRWKLGRNKQSHETRLQELRRRGVRVDDCPTLLELVVNRFQH